jgi:hypothetical protein
MMGRAIPLTIEQASEALRTFRLAKGNYSEAARLAGMDRGTFRGRIEVAQRYIEAGKLSEESDLPPEPEHSARIQLEIETGNVLIASDAHYWPKYDRKRRTFTGHAEKTTMHRAFVKAIKEIKPRVVIMNGDVFDGARASRHPPIGWESTPTIKQELEACQENLSEIEIAAEKAKRIWPLGNHDSRFETRLAMQAPEFEGVGGLDLKSHFPNWEPCWTVFINDDCVVKHRFRNGIHAAHNNTLWSGRTMVTGHLHSAKVWPLTDYNGTRWGVDSGTLCEAPWPQAIDYLEDNPINWRSAFVVLTFHKGRLLQPELCLQHAPGQVDWRGTVRNV